MAVRIRAKGRGRTIAGVSMAPMIDMVFLLLVFFMTASAISQAGNKVEIDLPESASSEVPKDLSDRFIVSIDDAGTLFLGNREIDEAVFREALVEYRSENPGMKLMIRAAKGTPYQEVREVMTLAAEAGVESYLYASYQAGGRE